MEKKTFIRNLFEDFLLGFMPMATPEPITGEEDGIAMDSLARWSLNSWTWGGLTLSSHMGKQSPKQNQEEDVYT